jgi:hypothetical protein
VQITVNSSTDINLSEAEFPIRKTLIIHPSNLIMLGGTIASTSNDESGSRSKGSPNGKRRKGLVLMALVLVVAVVLAIIGFIFLQEKHFDFTSFEGTSIITRHTESGDYTTTFHWQWTNYEAYKVGQPMDFWINTYNAGDGMLIMVGAASNTTGFTFTRSTPTFPITAPNTSDPDQGLKVTLAFDTPSSAYTGPFRFNIYYNWYPIPPTPPGLKNDISAVTETQVVSVHSSEGTTTQTYSIQHPEFAGEYTTGVQMVLNELYQYTGTGRANLSSIVANTPSFSFVSSTPTPPITLPNATKPLLSITLRFDSPSFQYNGSFNYTVYMDRYPEWVDPSYHSLTSVLEVQYVTSHYGPVSNTVKYLRWHNETVGLYSVGLPVTITEPFWNVASGTMSITNIVANTTGFALIDTNPSLPVAVPNSPDASHGNVTIAISFLAPTTQYTGHFEYTVYFDSYLT